MYLFKASSAFLLGFLPVGEILIAIPAAMASGLDPISVFVWCVLGNFVAVLAILLAFKPLSQCQWFKKRQQKWVSEKLKNRLQQHGNWVLLLITPIIGVWSVAITSKLVGLRSKTIMATSFISLVMYGLAMSSALHFASHLFV